MLRNYLPFYEISGEIQELLSVATLLRGSSHKSAITDTEAKKCRKLLTTIKEACEQHGLAHTAELAKRTAQREATT
jgi:hypothetical protein